MHAFLHSVLRILPAFAAVGFWFGVWEFFSPKKKLDPYKPLNLPTPPYQPPKPATPKSTLPRHSLGWRVLIIANERVIADTLAIILRQYGYETYAGYSGADAVEMARQLKPQVVICDVIMPDINGIDAVLRVVQQQPDCHTLLFSGHANDAGVLEYARARGYESEIMPMPFHPLDLVTKLRNFEQLTPS